MSEAKPPIEFDGAKNWHCMGVPYVILTHGGIKAPGDPEYPGGDCDSEQDAWEKYNAQLAAYITGADQIAWRIRPSCRADEGKFRIYSRLARFPQDAPSGE